MPKVKEAKEILENLGFDVDKIVDFQSEKRKKRILKIFCSVAHIKEKDNWSDSKSYKNEKFSIRSREIIAFLNKHYDEKIADGSYDDIRRKNLKYLEEAKIVDNSANIKNAATNNPIISKVLALNTQLSAFHGSFKSSAIFQQLSSISKLRILST